MSEVQRHVQRYLSRQKKNAQSLTVFSETMSTISGCERKLADGFSVTGQKCV
jgi:hypothetical protein